MVKKKRSRTIRISAALYNEIAKLAKASKRTIVQQTEYLIRLGMEVDAKYKTSFEHFLVEQGINEEVKKQALKKSVLYTLGKFKNYDFNSIETIGFLIKTNKTAKHWSVEIPAWGIHTQGRTRQESFEMAKDAVKLLCGKGFYVSLEPLEHFRIKVKRADRPRS